MKQLAYYSTAAFLGHYRVLSKAASESGGTYPMSAQDHETLEAMDQLMKALTSEECASLHANRASEFEKIAPDEPDLGLRERAQRKLHRLLVTKGIVHG